MSEFSNSLEGQIVRLSKEGTKVEFDRDPHGKSPHEAGAKLDSGKIKMGLVIEGFPDALREVGRVATHGAEKYTEHGWRSVPDGQSRYTHAMYRHLIDEASDGLVDRESGLLHAAHAAWNALARLQLMLDSQVKMK